MKIKGLAISMRRIRQVGLGLVLSRKLRVTLHVWIYRELRERRGWYLHGVIA